MNSKCTSQKVILSWLFFVKIFISFISPQYVLAQTCCTGQLFGDPSFEATTTLDEKFPNSTITATNNANTTNLPQWTWSDGSNSNGGIIINDASRATDGNQLAYLKTFAAASRDNRCYGNDLTYVNPTSFTCTNDRYTSGRRYVISYDYVPFNQAFPNGGAAAGASVPRFEHDFPNYTVLYDINGNNISKDGAANASTYEPAVAWADVKASWKTAYGVTPSISTTSAQTMWVSHASNATSGMLFDNVKLVMLTFSDAGLANVSCAATNNKLTFTLNPNANISGVPNIKYNVTVPAGFTISPLQGTYGQNTTFTLTTTTDGNFSDGTPTSINVTVKDDVNTNCSVVTAVINPYPCCVTPSAITLTQTAPTCTGATANNNGKITLSAATNGTHYGVSTAGAASYDGAAFATATAISGTPDVKTAIPNTGGTYIVRIFNGSSTCFTDQTITIAAVTCSSCILSASSTSTPPSCLNNDGAINLTVTGTTGTVTYAWSNGATSKDINALSAGDYQVTVTDANCAITLTNSLDKKNVAIQRTLCAGESYTLSISDNTLTNIKWQKDGVDISGETGTSYTANALGTYTYTSNNVGGCAIGSCCPIQLVAGNCCPAKICLPVTLVRNN